MADLDFPDSPSLNETFGSGAKIFKYQSSRWELVKFQPPDSGIIDGGGVSNPVIKIFGGSPSTDFTGAYSLDGGSL